MKVASELGKYKNFSGRILKEFYGETTDCEVLHSTFEIREREPFVLFYDGILKNGKLNNFYIKNAINISCDIKSSIIEYIINNGGHLVKNIIHNCLWKGGTWSSNYDKNLDLQQFPPIYSDMEKVSKIGSYRDFTGVISSHHVMTELVCHVEHADFDIKKNVCLSSPERYSDYCIVFFDGVLKDGEIHGAIFEGGVNAGATIGFSRIEWLIFKSGVLYSSKWLKGIWNGGEWGLGNIDKDGKVMIIHP